MGATTRERLAASLGDFTGNPPYSIPPYSAPSQEKRRGVTTALALRLWLWLWLWLRREDQYTQRPPSASVC